MLSNYITTYTGVRGTLDLETKYYKTDKSRNDYGASNAIEEGHIVCNMEVAQVENFKDSSFPNVDH